MKKFTCLIFAIIMVFCSAIAQKDTIKSIESQAERISIHVKKQISEDIYLRNITLESKSLNSDENNASNKAQNVFISTNENESWTNKSGIFSLYNDTKWLENGIYYPLKKEDEIIENRSRDSKIFLNSDGTYSAFILGDLHYLDKNRNWQDIELKLERNTNNNYSDYEIANLKNSHKTYFSKDPQKGFVIDNNNQSIKLAQNQTVFVSNSDGVVISKLKQNICNAKIDDNRSIVYENIYDGINLENILLKRGVEFAYLIENVDGLINLENQYISFSQEVYIPRGWKVTDDENNIFKENFTTKSFCIVQPDGSDGIRYNEILVYDGKHSKNEIMKSIEYPTVEVNDTKKEVAENQKNDNSIYRTNYKIFFEKDKIIITYDIPLSWLFDTDRIFPVYVDPVVELLTSETQSYWTGSGCPYNTYYHDSRYQSLFLNTDLISAGIPSGASIDGIDFNVCQQPGRDVKNFRIRLQNTSNTTQTSWITNGYTTNYGPTNIERPSTGWQAYSLGASHIWNGTNLLVDISRDNSNWSNGGGMYVRGEISNRACYGYSDSGYTWPFDGITETAFNYLPCIRINYSIDLPCIITSLDLTGSSRTPTLESGFYYFDVCKDEELTLQANSVCSNCGSGTDYSWVINSYDGNGATTYTDNPLNYEIGYAAGYDALLEIKGDNCYASYPLRFRSSDGPIINSISESITGCSGNSTSIDFGTSGNTIEVDDYHGEVTTTLGVGAETFIPDGPSCTTQCYESSVTFTDFAPGSTIASADDIKYLKINMEHSFIGDMQISLEGPDGCGSAIILQDNFNITNGGLDNATYNWPWIFIGISCDNTAVGYGKLVDDVWYLTTDFDSITVFETLADAQAAIGLYPLGFDCNSPTYKYNYLAKVAMGVPNTDDLAENLSPCDELQSYNSSGIGWDYCWSNNVSYSYAPTTNSYVYETGNIDYYDASESAYSFFRVNPSDESTGTNYYHPYEDFYTELVGCPLNGIWTIKVCDSWAVDNGWIFEWALALDPDLLPVSWDYNVGVDYADWSAINDADFDFISSSPLTYDLIPNPGLATGSYGGVFTVYDAFGCSTDANLDFSISGMDAISGIEEGDYVWAGFEGEAWDDDLHNWFVYDGSSYNYSTTYPDASKNVHIVDYCGNLDPKIDNSNVYCADLNIVAGKTLTMSPTTEFSLNISGDWNNNGIFIAGISNVNFNGSSTQNINTTEIGGETFYNLSINKTPETILNTNKDITVINNLSLTSGIINSNTSVLYLTNTSSASLVGGNTSGNDKYIIGKLQRATDGVSTYTFPIGHTGYGAQGFDIKPTGSSGSNVLGYLEPYSFPPLYSLSYCDVEIHPGGGTHFIGEGLAGYDGILDKINFDLNSPLQWDITNPNGGIGLYDISVYPSGTQLISSVVSANGQNMLFLMKNGEPGNAGKTPFGTGMPWFTETGFHACPNQTTLNGLTSFSKFNLIGDSGIGSALPIELLYFDVLYNKEDVDIEWSTISEINNDFFSVERSIDALNFSSIGKVLSLAPNGNSNSELFYHYYDRKVSYGTYYYRLKQYSIDGSYDYSNILTVNIGENEMFTMHPNPAKDVVEIEYYCNGDDESVIKIFDNTGKLVYIDKLFCFKGQNSSIVDISYFMPGIYMVVITSFNGTEKAKLIKY